MDDRLVDAPGLIGIGGKIAVATDQTAKRREIGAIDRRPEADLEFEGLVPSRQCRLRHRKRSRRIDSTGIDLDGRPLSTEQPP